MLETGNGMANALFLEAVGALGLLHLGTGSKGELSPTRPQRCAKKVM
jgi:hypothetical protein